MICALSQIPQSDCVLSVTLGEGGSAASERKAGAGNARRNGSVGAWEW